MEMARVPPLLFVEPDSVPTQPNTTIAQRRPAYFIAAMSNPHLESAKPSAALRPEPRLRPTRSRLQLRATEPLRTSPPPPPRRRESVRVTREAWPASEPIHFPPKT